MGASLSSDVPRTNKGKKIPRRAYQYTDEQYIVIAKEIGRRQYVINKIDERFVWQQHGWKCICERLDQQNVLHQGWKFLRDMTWQNMRRKSLRHQKYKPYLLNAVDQYVLDLVDANEKHFEEAFAYHWWADPKVKFGY